MADSTDPAVLAEEEDIRDDIALNEGLLESLGGHVNADDDSETEDSKRVIKSHLRKLRKRLRAVQPVSSNDDARGQPSREEVQDATILDEQPSRSQSRSSHHDSSGGSAFLMPPPQYDLVSRKRQRGDFDTDDSIAESSKSRRTTPSPAVTAAPSPADSTDSLASLDSDDPFVLSLFGDKPRDQARQNRDFWRQHEQRKRQEEEDAELAKNLSQGWLEDDVQPAQAPAAARQSDSTQTFFKTDGTINRRLVNPPLVNGRTSEPSNNDKSNGTRQPLSSPSLKRAPASAHASSSLNSTPLGRGLPMISRSGLQNDDIPGIPGSFPGSQPYTSNGGSIVYDFTPGTDRAAGLDARTRASMHYVLPPGLLRSQSSRALQWVPDDFTTPPLPAYSIPPAYSQFSGPTKTKDLPAYPQLSDPTKTKEELEDLLKHIRPDEELAANQVGEQPEGLKVNLMAHQVYGLAWMKKMEEGTNKGGILADDMGLGKTLQSIALMLSRPPSADKHRPTLVVAPVALIHQWKREIEKMVHSRHRLNVFVLHGDTRKVKWAALRAYDVVLTTYGLLASELKRKLAWEERSKLLQDAPPDDCPILGERCHFHRVILDEAQNIKNRKAKAALACCRIKSDHRWVLTGTPMQNNVEEMFSLIRFCRIRPYCEWDQFRRDISQPLKGRYEPGKERAMKSLQALLRAILLRRTKQSKINGQPILQLPEKITKEERVFFSEDELGFYKSLEANAQIQINKYIQRGSIGQNYSHALVLLLRLRQACCHPHLVTQSKDFIQTAGNLDTNDLLANAAQLDEKVIKRLKEMDTFECPICMDVDENPALFACGHALCNDCLSRLIDQAATDNENRPTCPHCRAPIDASKITDIKSFLRVHCPERDNVQPLEDEDVDPDSDADSISASDSDSDDDDDSDDLKGFIVPDDFDEESDSRTRKRKSVSKTKKRTKNAKSKGTLSSRDAFKSLAQLRKEGLKSKSNKRKYLRRLRKNFVSSAKIDKTVKLLEEIKARGKNEKTIIFSNFTSFLDLLEVPLSEHKALRNYARYDGSMSSGDRNDAVLEFTDNPNCHVILVSLKAGNAGLNLTAANHVVMLDPFWNPFVEFQAADRCYRIGQQQEVTVHRMLIGEEGAELKPEQDESGGFTVEDRILALQERKRELVETALDENAGRSVARLGVRELGYLFGLNRL